MLRVEDKKLRISSCALVVLRANRDFELPFSPQPARYNENAWSHFVHKPAQNQATSSREHNPPDNGTTIGPLFAVFPTFVILFAALIHATIVFLWNCEENVN